jgi:hypothetical protein
MSQINLSWTPSTDNVGVTVYRVERCGANCNTFASRHQHLRVVRGLGLAANTTYRFGFVPAMRQQPERLLGDRARDTTAPTALSALASGIQPTQLTLTWARPPMPSG